MSTIDQTKLLGHDDFETAIEELLLPAEILEKKLDEQTSLVAGKKIYQGINFFHTLHSLQSVCNLLGVKVKQTQAFSFLRDRFLRLPNQKMAISYQNPFCLEAATKVRSSNLYLNKTATVFTNNQLFNGWSGSTLPFSPNSQEKEFFPDGLKAFSHTYAEGGNVFCLTNESGIVKVCIGKDHLLQTLLLQELSSASWEHLASSVKKDFVALEDDYVNSLTDGEIFELIEEMYSLALLFIEGKSGLVPQQKQLELLMIKFYLEGRNTEKKTPFKDLVHSAGMASKLNPSGYLTTAFKSEAGKYAAKKAITKALIAKDFEVEEKDVHFVTQAGYHLDSFLTPGPKKTIFINSYSEVVKFLNSIEKDQESLNLSREDKNLLKEYIETANKLDNELSILLNKVKLDLKLAGFTVVDMPMHFVYEPKAMFSEFPVPATLPNAYFGNAITGWSEKEQTMYYIALGTICGEKLGAIFMESFRKKLLGFGEIKVFFVGNSLEDLTDFSEALDCWGRIDMQFGIHCASLPLKINITLKK